MPKIVDGLGVNNNTVTTQARIDQLVESIGYMAQNSLKDAHSYRPDVCSGLLTELTSTMTKPSIGTNSRALTSLKAFINLLQHNDRTENQNGSRALFDSRVKSLTEGPVSTARALQQLVRSKLDEVESEGRESVSTMEITRATRAISVLDSQVQSL